MSSADSPITPGPSPWSLVTALAAVTAGVVLIWWSRAEDRSNAGMFLGVALAVTVASLGVWAWDQRRRSIRQEPAPPANESLLAFSVAAGKLDEANAPGGVLAGLRDIDPARFKGLLDIRILTSPAAAGPSQVLVEATWSVDATDSDRQAFQGTLASLVADHEEQVVTDSLRTFTLSIVRDTRDVAFSMKPIVAVSLLGALAIVGFGFGALLTSFEVRAPAGAAQAPATPAPAGEFTGVMVEREIRFLTEEFTVPPNTEITITEDNQDQGVPHNIRIFAGPELEGPTLLGCVSGCEDGDEVVTPVRSGVTTNDFTFVTPDVGEYAYHCDIHPTTMTGVMTVREDASIPGEGQ